METVSVPSRLGVVGVGGISVALVDALLTGPHANDLTITVSPRSAHRSADLAARHPQVRVAPDNQGVLDLSDLVVLSVLPPQVADVCAALRFRPDHVVASLAAGWLPSILAEHVAPASTVCQLIPMPMISLHTGPIVMIPDVPPVAGLLEGCGDVVVVEREAEVLALAALSGTMTTYFELQATMVGWATAQGLDRRTATQYVTALLGGFAAMSTAAGPDSVAHLASENETAGGLNEQVRRELSRAGMFDELSRQLDSLRSRRISAVRQPSRD